jgi:hypothetical protein
VGAQKAALKEFAAGRRASKYKDNVFPGKSPQEQDAILSRNAEYIEQKFGPNKKRTSNKTSKTASTKLPKALPTDGRSSGARKAKKKLKQEVEAIGRIGMKTASLTPREVNRMKSKALRRRANIRVRD